MRIGELARTTGASPRSLRHYEACGLLDPGRDANGYRTYDQTHAVRVRNIRFLLECGLTLDDVRFFRACLDGDVAGARPSAAALALARERLTRIEERIAGLSRARDRLAERLADAAEVAEVAG